MKQHTVHHFKLKHLLLVLPLWAAFGSVAYADDLTLQQAVTAARLHDKEYLAAQTLSDTADALRSQAASLWRPQVMLSASAGKSSHSTDAAGAQFSAPSMGTFQDAEFNTSINNGTALQWNVSARQSLISPSRHAQSKQLKLGAQATDLQKQAATQALIIRIAQRYFDAQLAQQRLQLLGSEMKAVQSYAEEAKYRYDIGDRPVTEVYEAQARLAEMKAQQLDSQSDLQVKLRRLQSSIGNLPKSLPNKLTLRTPLQPIADLEKWQEKAKQNNLEIQMQSTAVAAAEEKVHEYDIGAATTLDLVAQAGRQKLTGNGDYGSASNKENNSMIGIVLNIPLYTGGYNSAKQSEAQAALLKAQIELEQTKERIDQQVEEAWLGVSTSAQQIQTLEAGLKASEARLDATRTGQSVGHRTVLDVLNAQNHATDVRIQLESTKENYVLSRLRLGAMVQELDIELLDQLVANN